ncbi:hypothetical protein FZ983_25255 [Azospirillum sp. B21]|uniref:hypothetical protein n=1 Tax=Azospirillum sp. B21 TaxID=2607496 RepID=UPI0011ECCA51|nr:hypothetical protein [Azospirillum sp. B21]KAA0575868.1 hypothetical protein FZ983_25255 [Azospirillum sp. B21]
MLVYGDRDSCEDPRRIIARLKQGLAGADRLAPGAERHGALVTLFIEAAELAQGLADLEFHSIGEDDCTPLQQAAMAVVMALAHRVAWSWWPRRPGWTGEQREAAAPLAPHSLESLAAFPLPDLIRMRRAEGYAFYSLYPEAYLEAAARLPPRFADAPVVIGLRSIGTGLAALAAVALKSCPPITLRPVGHPFRREPRISNRLRAGMLADPKATYVIVDEGPGLSGSSFGAVADWLDSQGVGADRIAFLPGHGGDLGPQASEPHRRRWAAAARPVIDFDSLFRSGDSPFPPLERWFEDLLGPALAPLEDLSGGAWRRLHDSTGAFPANPQQERRKFLLRTGNGPWLLKFAGLGRAGEELLERARALHAAGFTPEPVDLRHGFLAERWLEGARPLTDMPADAVDRLAGYLAFRARHLPAPPDSGAALPDLLTMARTNVAEALGNGAAADLDRWTPDKLAGLETALRRVVTDNRLHRWEWLRLPDGCLMKADALDHAAAHDLIGCQDIAWDVAGGIVEFDLSDAQARALCGAIDAAAGLDRRLLEFLLPCYIAFQIGYWTFAMGSDPSAAAERRRYEKQWHRRIAGEA